MTRPKKKLHNNIIKFSNLAIQMALIIAISAYIGKEIDAYLNLEKTFSLICSLIGVFGATFFTINGVKKL